jgi:fucose 4-O-acetylase-like acetyltransferase
MSHNAVKYPSPTYITLGRAALFVLFMQQAIIHVQRWDTPMTYESLISFLALALVFAALVSERRARIRG